MPILRPVGGKGFKNRKGASRFQLDARLPALFAGSHQNFEFDVLVNADLTGEPELAEHAIFIEALALRLTHRRLIAFQRHAASRAFCLAPAPVADIHAVLL